MQVASQRPAVWPRASRPPAEDVRALGEQEAAQDPRRCLDHGYEPLDAARSDEFIHRRNRAERSGALEIVALAPITSSASSNGASCR
jgi:hypothetical protein